MISREFRKSGFTLAELLIALGILAVLAIFTIPKILSDYQENKSKALVLEAVTSISTAYEAYKRTNTPSGTTGFADLTPYLNYVRVDSTRMVDSNFYLTGGEDCSVYTCILLPSGVTVLTLPTTQFSATASNNAIWFNIDPDGKVTVPGSPAYSAGKATTFWLYFNGRLRTYGSMEAGTVSSNWTPCCGPQTNADPDYFKDWQ